MDIRIMKEKKVRVTGLNKYIKLEEINTNLTYKLKSKYKFINVYEVYHKGKLIYLESFKKISGKDVLGN